LIFPKDSATLQGMDKPPPDPSCQHPRLRGPLDEGEKPGAYCDACGAEVPCPHPVKVWVRSENKNFCRWCKDEVK
jgi:hypothetical protein